MTGTLYPRRGLRLATTTQTGTLLLCDPRAWTPTGQRPPSRGASSVDSGPSAEWTTATYASPSDALPACCGARERDGTVRRWRAGWVRSCSCCATPTRAVGALWWVGWEADRCAGRSGWTRCWRGSGVPQAPVRNSAGRTGCIRRILRHSLLPLVIAVSIVPVVACNCGRPCGDLMVVPHGRY